MPRTQRLEAFPAEYYRLVEKTVASGEVKVLHDEPYRIRGRYYAFLAALRSEVKSGNADNRILAIHKQAEGIAVQVVKDKSITFLRKSDDPLVVAISEALDDIEGAEEKSAQTLLELIDKD